MKNYKFILIMIIEIKDGDILSSNEKYIVQQCNCTTKKSAGLSLAIIKKYPWADIYGKRKQNEFDIPGTIKCVSNGDLTIIYFLSLGFCL